MTHQYDSSNNLVGLQYCMVGYSPTWDAFWSVYLTCILIALSATGYGYMISALAPTVEAANALAPPLMVPLLLFGGFFLQSDSVPDYFIWLKYLSWFYYGAENLYVTQWKDSGACMSQVASRPDINPDSENIFRQIQIPSFDAICKEVDEALKQEDFTYENCTAITWEGEGQSTCNCLQATACYDPESDVPANTIYLYATGDDILRPFSYTSEHYWRNVGCLIALAVGFRFIGYLVLAFKFRKANR